MWEARLEPNVVSYNAVISACEKSWRWQRVLALLIEMREAKLEPDVISITTASDATSGRSNSDFALVRNLAYSA
eukprot:5380935-Pyramimonas_sp.AAC.1